ncbi:MAG TPA: hypothetical protein VFU98_01940 [Microlunatus sp.]|nr:hypothetical protein [Microlunatus sp.]
MHRIVVIGGYAGFCTAWALDCHRPGESLVRTANATLRGRPGQPYRYESLGTVGLGRGAVPSGPVQIQRLVGWRPPLPFGRVASLQAVQHPREAIVGGGASRVEP